MIGGSAQKPTSYIHDAEIFFQHPANGWPGLTTSAGIYEPSGTGGQVFRMRQSCWNHQWYQVDDGEWKESTVYHSSSEQL